MLSFIHSSHVGKLKTPTIKKFLPKFSLTIKEKVFDENKKETRFNILFIAVRKISIDNFQKFIYLAVLGNHIFPQIVLKLKSGRRFLCMLYFVFFDQFCYILIKFTSTSFCRCWRRNKLLQFSSLWQIFWKNTEVIFLKQHWGLSQVKIISLMIISLRLKACLIHTPKYNTFAKDWQLFRITENWQLCKFCISIGAYTH